MIIIRRKGFNKIKKEMEYVKVVTDLLMVSKFFTLQSDEDLHTLTLFGTLLIYIYRRSVMNAFSTKLDNKNWHFSNATLCSLLFYSGYVCSHLFLLNKNHLSINQELIPNLLKTTLPVLLIFHAFVVLFDDTKK
ncbi:hypothetical protein FQT01_14380 [Enterococcus faecalis]|nr:hypothetical protein [Enterococcus faecalis]EGO8666483.1 hypothetical protein [Enterococcus faecalis]EKZ0163886.1 hypothetical protein [Enterococcus faecalis]MBO1081946.1 hypothetical protein [Enterococcus faecalis]MBO1106458.1 hypothetical protein [Enterococcus faecalis]